MNAATTSLEKENLEHIVFDKSNSATISNDKGGQRGSKQQAAQVWAEGGVPSKEQVHGASEVENERKRMGSMGQA